MLGVLAAGQEEQQMFCKTLCIWKRQNLGEGSSEGEHVEPVCPNDLTMVA